MAGRYGLPTVGSVLANHFGIKWIVEGHGIVPTVDSLSRWRAANIQLDRDMYPAIMPQNLSPMLPEFIAAIDRCTTKNFTILDTMPGRRNDGHVPGGNHIDTVCHPTTNFLYLDAARVHETVIAHEFGHAWVQYVDECEDFRTLASADDPQKARLVGHVQSFVLDLKVNDLLKRKGFDMSAIEEDQVAGLANLAAAARTGYRPEHPKESVFMALLLADAMLARERNRSANLVGLNRSLDTVCTQLASTVGLARKLSESVNKHGYESRDAIIRCIDECLLASFEHASEPFDLDGDLTLVNPPEPNQDKFPNWLPMIPPRAKCVAGKHMARNDISSEWSYHVDPTITSRARVSFQSPDGESRSNVVLCHEIGPPTRYSGLPELVAENLALKHFNQTGIWQTHGGPPHPGNPSYDYDSRPPATKPTKPRFPQPPSPNAPAQQGSQSFRPRPYMAGLGRFLTAARLADQLSGEHPYVYAEANPITNTDPSGRMTFKQCEQWCEDYLMTPLEACMYCAKTVRHYNDSAAKNFCKNKGARLPPEGPGRPGPVPRPSKGQWHDLPPFLGGILGACGYAMSSGTEPLGVIGGASAVLCGTVLPKFRHLEEEYCSGDDVASNRGKWPGTSDLYWQNYCQYLNDAITQWSGYCRSINN